MKKFWFLVFALIFTDLSAQNTGLTDVNIPREDVDFILPDTLRDYTGLYPYEKDLLPAPLPVYYHIQTGSRLWDYVINRPLWEVNRKDYGFRLVPLLWLEAGKTNDSTGSTFINTRGLRVDGYVGGQVAFHTEIYENQARFPAYLYGIFTAKRTSNGFPAVLPGMGIAKQDRNGVLDFPSVRGHVTYRPSKFFLFRLGHGTPFIGYGYYSLLLGEDVPPYGYFRIESRFWHLRYVVMWSVLQDVRLTNPAEGVYHDKYMATHLLDWSVVPRVNVGLFENVIWDPSLGRGFDPNFLNPVIFFKTAEFQSGTKTANTLLGLQWRYKSPWKTHFYGQFVLDEMTVSKFFGQPGYWGNKYGFQLGLKSMQAWGTHRLFARLEYNAVRPFTYSHHRVRINYGHDNWPLAHPWGANFRQWLLQLQWRNRRWGADLLLENGTKGLDFAGNPKTYGGDIYRDYEERFANTGVGWPAGNIYRIQSGQMMLYYTLNPTYRLQVFAGVSGYKASISSSLPGVFTGTDRWFFGGLRTQLFGYKRRYLP